MIVGAGPVGLLLANLLGQRGQPCTLIERRTTLPAESRAIGVTPPSLRILHRLGLDQPLVDAGVRVTEAVVHGDQGELGRVRFDGLRGQYPFILAVPQRITMQLLAENLARYPSVTHRPGASLIALQTEGDWVEAVLDNSERVRARWVIGCDGCRSVVRQLSAVRCRQKRYAPQFVMGDFDDQTGWGTAAHLFFTARGSVESFALPGGQRRWIALGGTDLVGRVASITGVDLRAVAQHSASWFQPERLFCERYWAGRVILCGDAAHVMSPIGGQGMNTGFADAAHLAAVLAEPADHNTRRALLRGYQRSRQRAFRRAASRAARGMWIGTRTGRWASAVRNWFIGRVLLRPPVLNRLPAYFAMLTLPGGLPIHLEPPDAWFPNLRQRASLREWMERPDCDPERLRRTYAAFRPLNRLYARYPRILERWLIAELRREPARAWRIADLGSGAGDIAAWLARRCRQLGLQVQVIGFDTDPQAVAFARARYGSVPGLEFRRQDAFAESALAGIDYAVANHVLHHLGEDEVVAFFRRLSGLGLRGFVLNDLRRSYWAYYGHSLVGLMFPGTYVGVDGRLSLRRGFTMTELRDLARRAGLAAEVRRAFPARLVVVNRR